MVSAVVNARRTSFIGMSSIRRAGPMLADLPVHTAIPIYAKAISSGYRKFPCKLTCPQGAPESPPMNRPSMKWN